MAAQKKITLPARNPTLQSHLCQLLSKLEVLVHTDHTVSSYLCSQLTLFMFYQANP